MLFNSLEFLYFLPIVLALYYVLPLRGQNLWLLAASYVFYGSWDERFLSLILISTVVDYWCGMEIHRRESPRARKILLGVSLATNLGILGFFKYFNFFYDSAVEGLAALGVTAPQVALAIVLPVGISFYTFQTLSYTIDIYNRKLEPTRDFLNFALFVAFFPQLVAGPIERARNLIPQIENPRTITGYKILSAFWLILLGFVKKVAIGDAIAPYVDGVFNAPGEASGPMALGAIYLFAIQIYADFSGYSDIARGCARLMGIELMVNFRQPYLAKTIGEFWRRWHISLSTWFRDYVYIPLGGNRRGASRTYLNLSATMLITGLWHGANWTFIFWGVIHGVFLLLEKAAGMKVARAYEQNLLRGPVWRKFLDLLRILVIFHIAAFAFAIFRGQSISEGLQVIFRSLDDPLFGGDWTNLHRFFFFGGLMLFYDLAQEKLKTDEPSPLFLSPWVAGLLAALMLYAILVFGGQAQAFIYFQF